MCGTAPDAEALQPTISADVAECPGVKKQGWDMGTLQLSHALEKRTSFLQWDSCNVPMSHLGCFELALVSVEASVDSQPDGSEDHSDDYSYEKKAYTDQRNLCTAASAVCDFVSVFFDHKLSSVFLSIVTHSL